MLGERRLAQALRRAARHSSSPGADGMTWAQFRKVAPQRIPELARALREGTWEPQPVRPLTVTTYTGKLMPAVIPTVQDRVVHGALRAAAEPALEAWAFHDWVSGYRPKRSRITAVRQAARHMGTGRGWVADVDVQRVSEGGEAEEVIGWLASYVKDGVFLNRFATALRGLPSPLVPGTGLWPLLLNLRLHQVDVPLSDLPVVRFADNYCVFASSQVEAERSMTRIVQALASAGLSHHPDKSRIRAVVNPEDLFLIGG
ncbi:MULTISPECIES: Retron-type reverse transcriptase [unclassified Nocardiopsis]|uniref:Retron-type reverse transcriptase n=1 Tax=unclassified Nocardiopsis TaxID=2649073 RepID=UPI001F42A46D|nr:MULTISPECIES: Retron-type reverse transcriptase [unclassified Nocardiopsis]